MDMAKKIVEKIREYVFIIGVITGGVSFAWCKIAIPDIDTRIEAKQQPIIDALEFQNFLMMENMNDSAVMHAERKYLSSKRGSPR